MAILMDHTAPNGAQGNYFRINRIEGIFAPREPVPRWEVWVGFYASQEVRAENTDPIMTYRINVPFANLPADPRTGGMPSFYSVIKDYEPFAGNVVQDVLEDSPDLALDVEKALKKAELDRAWLAANKSTFPYQGKEFAIDEIGYQNMMTTQATIQATGDFPAGWPGGWKTTDPYPNETYISITTVDAWAPFFAAMTAKGVDNFNRAQALKKMVNEATSVNDVRLISWETPISTSAS